MSAGIISEKKRLSLPSWRDVASYFSICRITGVSFMSGPVVVHIAVCNLCKTLLRDRGKFSNNP